MASGENGGRTVELCGSKDSGMSSGLFFGDECCFLPASLRLGISWCAINTAGQVAPRRTFQWSQSFRFSRRSAYFEGAKPIRPPLQLRPARRSPPNSYLEFYHAGDNIKTPSTRLKARCNGRPHRKKPYRSRENHVVAEKSGVLENSETRRSFQGRLYVAIAAGRKS